MNYPFLLDTLTKSEIMQIDSNIKMKGEIDRELLAMNLFHFGNQADFAYLHINVHRATIVEDALNSLIREDVNFRKPLRVKFVSEPAVDEGGV